MLDIMARGGPIMWVLLVLSITSLTVFLERLFHLHRAQINYQSFLDGLYVILGNRNFAEAVSICDDESGPVAALARAAVLRHDAEPHELQQAVDSEALNEAARLESRVGYLAVTAHLAPLLGMLGTVLGLITSLIDMESQAPLVHSGALSSGLWQALLTTAFGLAVAIPAYAAYHFLLRRVDHILLDMDRALGELLVFLERQRTQESKPS